MVDGFTSIALLAYAAGIFHIVLLIAAVLLLKIVLTDIKK
jgi:hypothetical protein